MYSEICGLQKLGEVAVSTNDIFQVINIARRRSAQIHDAIASSLLALDDLKNQEMIAKKLSTEVTSNVAALDEAISAWNKFHQTVQIQNLP